MLPSSGGVVAGGWQWVGIAGLLGAGVILFQQTLQERTAPAASGSGSVALGKLAGQFGLFDANELNDFPLRDVKAEADFIVVIHDVMSAVATRQASK